MCAVRQDSAYISLAVPAVAWTPNIQGQQNLYQQQQQIPAQEQPPDIAADVKALDALIQQQANAVVPEKLSVQSFYVDLSGIAPPAPQPVQAKATSSPPKGAAVSEAHPVPKLTSLPPNIYRSTVYYQNNQQIGAKATTVVPDSDHKLEVPAGVKDSIRDKDAAVIKRVGYQIIRFIHFGPFSRIYLVRHNVNKSLVRVVKVEAHEEPKKTLGIESRVYADCKDYADSSHGFAQLYDRVQTSDGSRVIVMEQLGTDLSRIQRALPQQRLSTADALKVSLKTFCRIWMLHDRLWLHRDIKPSNFLIGMPGTDNADKIYIVDFGLARPISKHVRPTGSCPVVGTEAYRPISIYNRVEYQPRDDVESWFYMCHQFFSGSLPWQLWPHLSSHDFKLYCHNSGRSLLLKEMPSQFGAILDTIVGAKSSVDYWRISALLKSALAELPKEELEAPFAWQKDPDVVRCALALGVDK